MTEDPWPPGRDNPPDSAARIRDIVAIAGDEVDVRVENGLARHHAGRLPWAERSKNRPQADASGGLPEVIPFHLIRTFRKS